MSHKIRDRQAKRKTGQEVCRSREQKMAAKSWFRNLKKSIAVTAPNLKFARIPDAPLGSVQDPWPGDPALGISLLRDECEYAGVVRPFGPDKWEHVLDLPLVAAYAYGFSWLRDLRALGTDAARLRARAMLADWMDFRSFPDIALQPDVLGTRLASWLGHYDFFAASADDEFRQALMTALVQEGRQLAASLPFEMKDGRVLSAFRGLTAVAVALPDQENLLNKTVRMLPSVVEEQILSDGSHIERSPSALLQALQDLIEIRALLQARHVQPPPALVSAIERAAPTLRNLRHGDGGLALFNGSKEGRAQFIDLVLTRAGRSGRTAPGSRDGGFYYFTAGRSTLLIDGAPPPPKGADRKAHAGTLSFEFSAGRERIIVNCGSAAAAGPEWYNALRMTAAHSTVSLPGGEDSSVLLEDGLEQGMRVDASRQEANGAFWFEAYHDGWRRSLKVIHRRRLYLAESGEDLRGEDSLEGQEAVETDFYIRFHLHPEVSVFQETPEAAVLTLKSGACWRLRTNMTDLAIEESVYLGNDVPTPTKQVVVTVKAGQEQPVKWALIRIS